MTGPSRTGIGRAASKIDNHNTDIDNRRVSSPDPQVSKIALVVMLVIVVVFALVALYANAQRLRRDKIESVTITPAASPSATASP